jgi:dimethylamine/trimethylamine dehydrogenase
MVRMIRQGVLDLIGAARPSIADPFLPNKIEEGRLDDIRECIGCNICVAGDNTMSPIRCTQNPTMGEEWRRGWHPERIRPKPRDSRVLVVGAGPAGLEAAQALGKRGYRVVLLERSRRLGGRVVSEASLPGLATWIRVLDYRLSQLRKLGTVEHFLESDLTADEILEYGFDHVAVATGARWRSDGVGRWHTRPIDIDPAMEILNPDQLMEGIRPRGEEVVVFDDDHYYMGGVLAELLAAGGYRVSLLTAAPDISHWTHNTLEQERIQRRVLEAGIEVIAQRALLSVGPGSVVSACRFTGREEPIACDSTVLVTARLPTDRLYQDLIARRASWKDAGIASVKAVGDCLNPSTIAAAVWDGHRYAEDLDLPDADADHTPFLREVTALAR